MSYVPPSRNTSGGNYQYGQAKIQISQDGKKVRVLFKNNEGETSEHVLDRADCPETVRPGVWIVSMGEKFDKLFSLRPIQGVFNAVFHDMVREKDKPPVPQTKIGKSKDGGTFEYQYFRPLFCIVDGPADGLVVGYKWGLHYEFDAQVDDNGREVVGYSKSLSKSTHVQDLHKFLTAVGVWDDGAMPYKPNVLPMVYQRAKKAGKQVQLVVVDGNIDSIVGLPDSESFE